MSLIECRGLGRTYRRGSEEIKPLEDLDLDIDDPKALAAIWPAMSADLLGRVSARMRAELEVHPL